MHVHTDANTDEQSMSMRTSGLQEVPEPFTLSLMLIGGAVLGCRARHREPLAHNGGDRREPKRMAR